MCPHALDILSMWMLCFSLLCATASAFQPYHLAKDVEVFCHELYEQSTVMFCRSGRDACFTIVCILCADHVFWYPWFLWQEFNSFVSHFGLHANIVEEYVLLSALLHDQSCLQSSSCFQHQLVWLPFVRTLVCKGGCSFHVHGSTRVVSSSLCYVAVSRARENNWDKPLLDVIIAATITERS